MRKSLMLLISMILMFSFSNAQKVQVYYFKADLACCQGKACTALQGDVRDVFEKNFKTDDVSFKVVRIADPNNAELVTKYNAKSQTVVIVSLKKKKDNFIDVSDIIRKYQRNQNKNELEKELIAKVNQCI